jgi:hypothetical protein
MPASRATGSFGKAKACILLFPYGSPSQHETFDPKPEAPAEIQGEMKAFTSRVPGLRICERLRRIASVTDKVTVVRSMSHPYPEHGVAYAVTGMPTYTPALETRPRDPAHWPFIGSVVDYLDERRSHDAIPAVPRNIGLPWLLNSKADIGPLAGPYAAFLAQAYDPVWADFATNGAPQSDGEGPARCAASGARISSVAQNRDYGYHSTATRGLNTVQLILANSACKAANIGSSR